MQDFATQTIVTICVAIILASPCLVIADSWNKPDYRYMGSWKQYHHNSGKIGVGTASLISPRWALTAYHVAKFKDQNPNGGSAEIVWGGQKSKVLDVYKAPGVDIALIKLRTSITGITPVSMLRHTIGPASGNMDFTLVQRSGKYRRTGHAIKGGESFAVNGNPPGKAGDSGGPWVVERFGGLQDIQFSVLHGTGLAPQLGPLADWIDRKVGAGKVHWVTNSERLNGIPTDTHKWTGNGKNATWTRQGNWGSGGTPGKSGPLVTTNHETAQLSWRSVDHTKAAPKLENHWSLGRINILGSKHHNFTLRHSSKWNSATQAARRTIQLNGTDGQAFNVRGDTKSAFTYTFQPGVRIKVNEDLMWDVHGDETLRIQGSINGTGQIVKGGSGTLSLDGQNIYTGGTVVHRGTLAVNGSIIGNTLISGGRLAGTGSITGGLEVMEQGTISAGNSLGTMQIEGDLMLTGKLLAEIKGSLQGINYDLLNVDGIAHLAGVLDIDLLAGFNPNVGDTFELLLATKITLADSLLIDQPTGLEHEFSAWTVPTQDGQALRLGYGFTAVPVPSVMVAGNMRDLVANSALALPPLAGPESALADAQTQLAALADDHITRAQAEELRSSQLALKAAIESLDDPGAWISEFDAFVAAADESLASRVLRVGGHEANHASLLLAITGHYTLMPSTGAVDFARFAGVASQDLEGLESLAEYFAAQRIGTGPTLPTFALLSPLGNLQLLDRLIRKFDTVHEATLLRHIDGTATVYGDALAAAAFAATAIPQLQNPLTIDAIRVSLDAFDDRQRAIQTAVAPILEAFSGEAIFRNRLASGVAAEINRTLYREEWNAFTAALRSHSLLSAGQLISAAELNSFSLPYNLATWQRYPGAVPLDNLIPASWYNALYSIDLVNPLSDEFAPSDSFSYPTRRFEILAGLLRAYPDAPDLDSIRARLLINPTLEIALDQSAELIADRIRELRNLSDYDSMVDLLLATTDDLRLHFQPLLADVVWDTSNEVTSRVNTRFAELAAAFDAMLPTLQAQVLTVDDRLIAFDPRPLLDELLIPLLDATAVGQPREAWLRLTGITSSTLEGLRSSQQLDALNTFRFNTWSLGSATSFDRNELLFRLVPRLVQQFGSADHEVLLAQLSTGLTLPVSLGQDLESSIKFRVSAAASRALAAFPSDSEAARARLAEFASDLAPLRSLAAELSPGESASLEAWINWERNSSSAYHVRISYDQAIASVGLAIADILRISQFPTASSFNRELFIGISDDDLAGVELAHSADADRYFYFSPSNQVGSSLSALGRVQLASMLWARHGLDDVEAFRRRIKGIGAMITRLIAGATEIANSANAQLQTAPTTVAEATALYEDVVLDARAQLLTLLQSETQLHEKNDVIEAEAPVTAIFQAQVFETWVDLVGSAHLGHPIIAALSDIEAAHELASHYGLSLDDIRGLHRLENYLGEQVIALPRTSQYVDIVSQLSELGWLQLADLLVQRHGPDLDSILAALSDRATALANLHSAIDSETAEFANQLDAAGTDLEALDNIMHAVREALVRLANDFLAGLTDADIETLRADLEATINDRANALAARRDSIVSDAGLDAHVDRFVEIASAWLATNPAPAPGPIIFFRSAADIRIWLPPLGYDPSQHPTRQGMITLFHRLADHFGDFVETEGAFDMAKFETELFLAESDRARRRLDALRERELPIAQALVSDPLPLAEFASITAYFLGMRSAIQSEVTHDHWQAQSTWQAFVDVYEGIQNGEIERADGSRFRPAALDKILLRLDSEDAIDPGLMASLQPLIDGGEDWWSYEQFRQLDYIWHWDEGFGSSSGSTVSDDSLTLGELARVPAIKAGMLEDLEVVEGIALIVTVADSAEMLGLLNVRAIAGGSGVSAGGLLGADSAIMADEFFRIAADGLAGKSWRFRVTELLPALIDAIGGITDSTLFEQALRGETTSDFSLTVVTDDSLGEIEILEDNDGWQLHARPFHGFRFRGWSGDINWLQNHRTAQQQLELLADAFLVANFAANRPPVARPDASSGEGLLQFALLDNDEDEDGDALSAWLTELPSHGEASLTADGQLDYRPAPGFSGRDVLRYVVSDGDAESAPTLVTVDVIGTLDLHFEAGWNLFSLPFEVVDASELPALRLRWNGKRFAESEALRAGVGYWGWVAEKKTVAVRGGELGVSDVPLKPGWNLLGPVTRCACPAVACITSVLAWDANSATLRALAADEQFEPGQAYGVHVSARCVLRLAD